MVPWVAAWAGCVDYHYDDRRTPRGPRPDPPSLPATTAVDRIVQTGSATVDVLFTIDNSCSMADEQAQLSASFPRFVEWFVGSGLDWHVGVLSTDLDDPAQQGRLRAVDGASWLDEATPDPVGVFTAMATLGTTGSADERGLGAEYLALEIYRDSFNAGFYREDASIHSVIISDEPDQTQDTIISVDGFVDWYGRIKDHGDRTFSAIVPLTGEGAATDYLAVSGAIGGAVWEIDDAEWDSVLAELGLQISGSAREFFLSRLPAPETIEVAIEQANGAVLNGFAAGVDWTWDATRNSVSFVEIVPDPLSVVVISYAVAAGPER